MAKAIYAGGLGITTNAGTSSVTVANTTIYFDMFGSVGAQTTANEADAQILIKSGGTFSNFGITVGNTNTIGGTSTVRVRKNTANGNQVVSIGANATGLFEDTTHSDSVVSGDLVAVSFTPGAATGTTEVGAMYSSFDSSNTVKEFIDQRYVNGAVFGSTLLTAASTSYFLPLHGQFSNSGGNNTTESKAQTVQRFAGTFLNLCLKVKSNSRTTTTTANFRKNTANGNQTVSVGSTATGTFEDTTHTDTVAASDNVNYSIVNGTGTSAITYTQQACNYQTSINPALSQYISSNVQTGAVLPHNLTNYIVLEGKSAVLTSGATVNSLEVPASIKAGGQNYTFKNLSVNIVSNTVTATSTWLLRIAGVDTAITTSIGSSATGVFQDTTHTATNASTTALIVYKVTTGATGTEMIPASVNIYATEPVDPYTATINESAITAAAATIVLNVIRKVSETAITVSQTLVPKVTRVISEPSKSISNTLSLKVIRPIPTTATTTSDSIVKLRHYFRTINETAITLSQTLFRKVTRIISEPAKTIGAGTVVLKVIRVIAEPAKTISQTLILKTTRVIAEPAKTVSDIIIKKAFKTISEPAKTIVGTLSLKVVRPISNTVTTSSSLSRIYKAIKSISEPAKTVSDAFTLRKVTRIVSEPAITKSDTLVGHKLNAITINEPAKTITDAIITLKVLRRILEPAKTINDSIIFKVSRIINDPAKSISQTLKIKVIRTIAEPSVSVGASVLTRIKKAVRSLSEPSITVGASTLTKRTFNNRTVSEAAINNLLDSIVVHKIRNVLITDPAITVSDTNNALTRRALFVRTISEIPSISVADIINKSTIIANEQHRFKLGLKFKVKRTDDQMFVYQNITDSLI